MRCVGGIGIRVFFLFPVPIQPATLGEVGGLWAGLLGIFFWGFWVPFRGKKSETEGTHVALLAAIMRIKLGPPQTKVKFSATTQKFSFCLGRLTNLDIPKVQLAQKEHLNGTFSHSCVFSK